MRFKAAILVGQRVSFVAKFDREFRSAASRVGVNENVGDALVFKVHYQRLVDQVALAAIRCLDWFGFWDIALEDKFDLQVTGRSVLWQRDVGDDRTKCK